MMFATDPGAVVVQLLMSGIDAFALTVLVFFRKDFGERFLTLAKYMMGVGILSFLMGVRALAHAAAGMLPMVMGMAGGIGASMLGVPPVLGGLLAGPGMMMGRPQPHVPMGPPPPHALFDAAHFLYWAFIIVGGLQLVLVMLRSWGIGNATPVYSRSTGEPLLSFGGRINHWLAVIILEPLAVLMLGQLLKACDPNVPYAYFVVLALFIQASSLHQFHLYRSDMLDEQDARLLASFYTAQAKNVAEGKKPTSKLGGFFMPLLLPKKPALQLEVLRQWAKRHQDSPREDTVSREDAGPRDEVTTPPPPPQQPAA
jgi:hypothetical protein